MDIDKIMKEIFGNDDFKSETGDLDAEMNAEDFLEFADGFNEEIQTIQKELKEEAISEGGISMKDLLLQSYSKKVLIEICKVSGIGGYSRMKVGEIAQLISDNSLEYENAKRFILNLDKNQISLAEEIIDNANIYYAGCEEEEIYYPFILKGYAVIDDLGILKMAYDFSEILKRVLKEESFEEEYDRSLWIRQVFVWANLMYLDTPMDVFMKLVRLKYDIDQNKVINELLYISDRGEYLIDDEEIICYRVLESEEFDDFFEFQEEADFYIPQVSEIDDLYYKGYLSKELKYINIRNWFMEYNGLYESEADEIAFEIWNAFGFGFDMNSVEFLFDQYDIVFESEKELAEFVELLKEAILNTRTPVFKGYKMIEVFDDDPFELLDKMGVMDLMNGAEEYDGISDNVISMDKWKKNKIN